MTPFIFASGGQPGGPSAVHSKFTTSPPADFQKWEIFTSKQYTKADKKKTRKMIKKRIQLIIIKTMDPGDRSPNAVDMGF